MMNKVDLDMADGSRFDQPSGLSSRTFNNFHRKTRTGSVVKVAREHYLRHDIDCGIAEHMECRRPLSLTPTLTSAPQNAAVSKAAPFDHILVLDVDVALHRMDLFGIDFLA